MNDKEFAAACAAIETIALNNSMMLKQHYGTSKEDVQKVLDMARTHWFKSSRKGV